MEQGRVFYVAITGDDSSPGSKSHPFRSIQRAADEMRPGDECVIRQGTYREWVKPRRGGISETMRLTFRAETGERVQIKGSEPVTTWVRHERGTWRVDLADDFFGDFNPYKRHLAGGWLLFGQACHLGAVYLNGSPFTERLNLDEVNATAAAWYTESLDDLTRIYANFGEVDPNRELVEINVRECVFFPTVKGTSFITLNGLHMMHAAANWVNFTAFQHAAVGTYYGKGWIIENCTITDAKCAGLVCGNDPSGYNEGFDIEATGHHMVRNNYIARCGEAGIHGYKGWAASLIECNLIEDINMHEQFGGYETAGIKLHHAIDVVVRNNIIRRVHSGVGGQYAGIWIDWAAQGARITGNIVYDLNEWTGFAFFIQNGHGAPLLVDNNIFAGQIYNTASNSIFAHNLFIDCRWFFMVENMDPVYWRPHSGEVAGLLPLEHQENDRYFNNIFIRKGSDQLINARNFRSDWNVYIEGARPGQFGDLSSITSQVEAHTQFVDEDDGVTVTLCADDAPHQVGCPLISHDFIGTYSLTGQGLETHDGTRFNVDIDIYGLARDAHHPAAGPLETLRSGQNTIRLRAGPCAKIGEEAG